MQKKIYLLVLLLLGGAMLKAQNYYPHVVGYAAGERVVHQGTAPGDTFSVSFSGGAPFATTWQSALPAGTNYALSGMRHDILFLDYAFEKDLFASKGYYGDYVEIKWDMVRYADQTTGFLIYRKQLGSADDSVLVATLPADVRTWRDEYAESAVMYQYFLFAKGIFPTYRKFMNYIEGVGFRMPYGKISGRVTYDGGAAVPGVSIIAETDDNFSGSSIYLNGTDAYLAVSPKMNDPYFEFENAMTFQGWFCSDGNNATRTLLEKQGQYKLTHSNGTLSFTAGSDNLTLNFTEKQDTFFHVAAMRTADSIKLIVIYDENTSYIAKDALSSATTPNNNEIYIGKDGGGNFFKGWVDEVKIWHKSFTEQDILQYAGMYFAGTEDSLSCYFRMNEGIGNYLYDLSRKGFSFNENHAYKHSTAQWSEKIPFPRQLAVKGITDNNGNYIISGIPYATDGSIYRFVPVFGVHSFDPTEQLLYIGSGATTHSNINFIDVASFPVTGHVYYKDTYFPVEGVTIKIDGQTAITANGNPIVTNAQGRFTVDVPIGQHFIQLYKYGHGFENNGRFPPNEGEYFDFQAPYTFQTNFLDTTKIKVIGKVVGGPVQANKPKGLGKSTNNIGNAKIILGTQKGYDLSNQSGGIAGVWENEMYENQQLKDKGDTKFSVIGSAPKQIEIEPDTETGEFVAYLLPEQYVIKSITAGSYTYPGEFHQVVDLRSAFFKFTEIDSVRIEPPIISPIGDTIYSYRIDSTYYQRNLDLIYRVNPSLTVTAKDGTKAFWENSVKAKDGSQITVTELDGTPKTQFPIFLQRKQYDMKVNVFEQYANVDLGTTDQVPVTDGVVEIQNSLALDDSRKQYQISELGDVKYRFTAGLPNIVGDFTKAMSVVAYTGNNQSIQTTWEYVQTGDYPYTGPFKGYVFGGMPTGNNFVTTGPNEIDMIIRDPYGSSSFAYMEAGQTFGYSISNDFSASYINESNLAIQMGAKVITVSGSTAGEVLAGTIVEAETIFDVEIGAEFSYQWENNNTYTYSVTNTKLWQTSGEEDFVGSNGDVFIGHSTNIVYGLSKFIDLVPQSECSGCISGTQGYDIGLHTGLRISPEFGTAFQYSQNHIKNYLIPNLEFLRNSYLQNSPYHTSHIDPSTDDYGRPNTEDLVANHTMNPGDTTLQFDGDSYSVSLLIGENWPSTKEDFTDSVLFYNQQIQNWKQILARNEKEKLQAKTFENISFDGGTVYESSTTIDSEFTYSNSFEFTLAASVLSRIGGEVLSIGMAAEVKQTYEFSHTHTIENFEATSTTFGYELSDPDEGDYFSLDLKKPKTNTSTVFAIRGGQSQCPHEDAELTEFFQPGTTFSQATMQREVPGIACDIPVQTNVPEDQKASFNVQLQNLSETDDDAWFMVSIDEQSNQNGTKISLDGHSISNGRIIFIPAGTVLNKVITIEKNLPDVNHYEDIGIILHSVCQFDPGNDWPDIADTVKLTAHFKPVCSKVELTTPNDLWVVNTNTNPVDVLNVTLDNYNLAHSGFEKLIFQYKPTSTSQWISDKYFFVNQDDYNNSTASNKQWINGAPSLTYNWDMSSLQDRNYHIRAISTCADGTQNESLTLSGIKDTKRPMIFGSPQPGDGILSPGDDVMLSFDEAIEAGILLSSNFSVRGELNGAEIRHNSALYFDGNNDYASVIAGVNLQNKSFAIEFWTKRGDLSPGVIFEQADIQIGFDASSHLYVTLGAQTQATALAYDFTDKWIHFTLSYDYQDRKLNLYSAYDGHNAIEFEDVIFPAAFAGNGRMYVGKDAASSQFFNGYLHDFRIWEKTRGYASANSDMLKSMNGDEIGLGGMWPMNEARGDYAQDLAREHHAMLVGATWKVFPTGYARTFDGSSAYIDFPTASSVIVTDEMDFTLEFWFKAPPQSNTILFSNGKGDGTDGTDAIPFIWTVGINANGELYAKNNSTTITAMGSDFLDNQWHHFALVLKRNANTSLYVDGNLQKYEHSSNFGGLKGANMTLGASRHYTNGTPYSNFFSGSIDEFRIWNLARTAKLLDLDMNAKLSGDEKGLVAYYPFDQYDVNLVLQPTLNDNDINDNTGNLTGLSATATGGNFNNTDVPNLKDARPVQNLAFNWVVNEDQIVINLDEPAELIEKCVIEFTVDRVEDLRENRMASPVTWTAYIKKNTVIWNESQLNFEKRLYDPLSFEVDILNIGGVEQNFIISNLPAWLSAETTEGSLAPDSKQTISFTVSENVNIGNYDVSIFLTSDFGYSEKLELSLKVYQTPPSWHVNPQDFQYSMSVIGQVKIDGIFSTNPDDIVAAFVGNECRGVANLQYVEDYDMFEVFLNVYSNQESGENVTFKIWNASEGIVHDNVTPLLTFEYNDFFGTPAAPEVLETYDSYSREILLPQGWKWISFNLNDIHLSNVNLLFEDIEAQPGDQIKGQTVFDNYGTSYGWNGSLSNSGGFQNEQMYMVKLSKEDTLHLSGSKLDPLAIPILLNPGWNWIGYTPQVNIEVNDAMANINPTTGDLIKSQYAFAIYDPSMGWIGSLRALQPATGYMYKNQSTNSISLVFPASGLKNTDLPAEKTTQVAGWELKPENYQYNMSLIGKLVLPQGSISENHVIGAFAGNQCRAIAAPIKHNGEMLYFISIFANQPAENIRFELLNQHTNQTAQIIEQFSFVPNHLIGSLDTPQPLNAGFITGINTTTGRDDMQISIFPNPSKGDVVLKLSGSRTSEAQIEIISPTGQVLKQIATAQNRVELDFAPYEAGLYFLKVKAGGKIFFEKVVVQ